MRYVIQGHGDPVESVHFGCGPQGRDTGFEEFHLARPRPLKREDRDARILRGNRALLERCFEVAALPW